MEIRYSDYDFFDLKTPFRLGASHLELAVSSVTPSTVDFLSSPVLSLYGRVKHLIVGLIDLTPLVGAFFIWIDRYLNSCEIVDLRTDLKAKETILSTPQFRGYRYQTPGQPAVLMFNERPVNFLVKALLGFDPETKPGSGEPFAFHKPSSVKSAIKWGLWWDNPIEVSAIGALAVLFKEGSSPLQPLGEKSMDAYLGRKVFRISHRELKSTLESQKILISPLIPRAFYLGLKEAFYIDKVTYLPRKRSDTFTLSELTRENHRFPNLKRYLRTVEQNPRHYGFTGEREQLSFKRVWDLTLYQIGAMVVKTEEWRCLVDENFLIEEREVGRKDGLLLLNLSGIRDLPRFEGKYKPFHQKVMEHTFRCGIIAAGKEAHFVVPAVGMGIGGGDPGVYWRAFLDAVVSSGSDLSGIYVNPTHQKTKAGPFSGYQGEEFASLLEEYKRAHPKSEGLKRIVNLYERQTDLLFLAKNLKKRFPDQTVALINPSDPDATLGNIVGEQINEIRSNGTTEENFTALGTNGLCFEKITGIFSDVARRVIQMDPPGVSNLPASFFSRFFSW